MSDFTITAESREEVESLFETLERENWKIKNYEVDNAGAWLEVRLKVRKMP